MDQGRREGEGVGLFLTAIGLRKPCSPIEIFWKIFSDRPYERVLLPVAQCRRIIVGHVLRGALSG